uniref:Uncharacterized protein n=1 Tax=Timema bartmani TaxID=61472 RepID=A0A7R9EXG3_9NEOP|nr:unnamed protein product [Timema bartmani]
MPGLYVTASAMYACAIPWVEASCTVLLSNAEAHQGNKRDTGINMCGSLTNPALQYIGMSSSSALYATASLSPPAPSPLLHRYLRPPTLLPPSV